MTDRYEFVTEAAAKLRSGDISAVDLSAVAEELEQVGRSDARELRHRVEQIIEHMLKLGVVKGVVLAHNARLWEGSVNRQRHEIATLLEESPSLKGKLTPEMLKRCYETVAGTVRVEYGVKVPARCPWGIDEVIGT